MRTREESLNNFCKLVNELISVNYLLANSKIFEVVTSINSSKLLTEMFNYFSESFDFESVLSSCFTEEDGVKKFTLPQRNTDVLALVYLILREINFKNLQLTDLLEYFDGGKNYEQAYNNFGQEVLLPFKTYSYQIGRIMINSTQSESEAMAVSVPVVEEPISGETLNAVEKEVSTSAVNVAVKVEEKPAVNDATRLVRLIELDKLSVTQSRLSKDEKNELNYVLELFESEIKKGDSERINLAYLAYVYAFKSFKKVKNNIKEITDIIFS